MFFDKTHSQVKITMDAKENVIRNYVAAYNRFDLEGMLKNLSQAVHFQNVSDGEVTFEINGLAAFKEQATQAMDLFSTRQQTIVSITHDAETTEVTINYHAVAAVDLPNGPKKGEVLKLVGKSIFTFDEENKIKTLKDIS